MSVTRNAFKLFVTIDSALTPGSEIMEAHKGYPIDNVIQIKLDQDGFVALFKETDPLMSSSGTDRYDPSKLLERFSKFFSRDPVDNLNNYNNLASDITTLINNTYNDIDVNPVALESACATDGEIFNYFIKSKTQHRHNPDIDKEYGSSEDLTDAGEKVDEYGVTASSDGKLLVYEVIARELDNMISRNVNEDNLEQLSTSLEYNYSDLDNLFTIVNQQFWENIQVGDSIFIEGSFEVPTANPKEDWKQNDVQGGASDEKYEVVGGANLPIILQFVHSSVETYQFD